MSGKHGRLCRYPVLSALCQACVEIWAGMIREEREEKERDGSQ